MKLISSRILFIALLALSLFIYVVCQEIDGYEYEYEDESNPTPLTSTSQQQETVPNQDEYEYYDDESVDASIEVIGEAFVPPEAFYGFHRHVGGGLMKVAKPLVDETYINETVELYECVRMIDSMTYIVEANNTEEAAVNITAQIDDLKKKIERVMQSSSQSNSNSAIQSVDGSNNNTTAATNKTEKATPAAKTKRMSFREKQALRLQQRKEKQLEREQRRPMFRLGADCETLVCGACKAIVEEFSILVKNSINNPDIRYIDQLTEGFCSSKAISLKYGDIVSDVCRFFEQVSLFHTETLGYKETLVSTLESAEDWEVVNQLTVLRGTKQAVCTTIGACEAEQFEFQSEAAYYLQEQWDDRCFTCQAFAKDLEERIQLARHLTERSIVPLVAETCDRLDLPDSYREVCQLLTTGKMLDDIAWLAKMHGESIARKAKAEQKFPDKLCEEINWCKPWMDPEKLKEKDAQANMEQVFF